MHPDTRAVHAGRLSPERGLAGGIEPSTTFARRDDGTYGDGFSYSREAAPNRAALEAALAALEGGADAACFASGLGAMAAALAALAPGDEVLVTHDAYYSGRRLMSELFGRWGLRARQVDLADRARLAEALSARTKLLWVETPSNPMLRLTDIAAVAEAAHRAGALVAVDNTTATPVFQSPLALGADLVMHSATKYLGGHSDLLGGCLVTARRNDYWTRIREAQTLLGATPSAQDCWLISRGLQTLGARLARQSATALALAKALEADKRVAAALHPGLASHPDHALAARQTRGHSGLVSIRVKAGREAALAATRRTRLFVNATSFGGPHSLIEHRASVEGPHSRTPDNLLRLSIGLEAIEDLLADLDQALG